MTTIKDEHQLEDILSTPSSADVHSMESLEGDILVLGAAGKMGPSLCRLARRALDRAGKPNRVIAVARFTNRDLQLELEHDEIETIACDLLEPGALGKLPDSGNVVFMAAKKFGTTGAEHTTWAMNTYLPALVADRYRDARIVSFSTGNVYPLCPIMQGGATERTPVSPIGEYAQSALGRERMFEYGSEKWGTPGIILRLNYAVELRYGVLVDIGLAVFEHRAVDLRMGLVNVIWQRDANSVCLRAFEFCESPPRVFNITGPETLSVRYIAEEFGRRFKIDPIFSGEESTTALLNNAAEAHRTFGYPTVSPLQMIDWISDWIKREQPLLRKPTHFAARDGKF